MNLDELSKIANCEGIVLSLIDKNDIAASFQPYVYLVVGKQSAKYKDHFYIGSKSKINCRDVKGIIGVDYFTSSSDREFTDDFTLHPNNYQSVIVHASDDYGEEYQIEQKLIEKTFNLPGSLNKAVYKNSHITLDSYDIATERMKKTKARWTAERRETYRKRYKESLKNRTAEHEALVKKNVEAGRKRMWAKRTEEQKKVIFEKSSQTRQTKSDVEKAAISKKLSDAAKLQNSKMTAEQKAAANEKRSKAIAEHFVQMKEGYAAYKKNGGDLKWNEWQKSQK